MYFGWYAGDIVANQSTHRIGTALKENGGASLDSLDSQDAFFFL
jgi:hypothetical protein